MAARSVSGDGRAFLDQLERRQVPEAEVARVARAVDTLVRVPLEPHQFDALVAFALNVGTANLAHSTLLKQLNQQQHADVPGELARWSSTIDETTRARVEHPGLAQRRAAEARYWRTGQSAGDGGGAAAPHAEGLAGAAAPPEPRVKGHKESFDAKPSKDDKDGKDSKDEKDSKDGKDSKDDKDGKDSKDGKDDKESSDGKSYSDGKSDSDGKSSSDGKYGSDGKSDKDGKESGKDGKDGKDLKDGKDGKDGKDSKDNKDSKDYKDGKDVYDLGSDVEPPPAAPVVAGGGDTAGAATDWAKFSV